MTHLKPPSVRRADRARKAAQQEAAARDEREAELQAIAESDAYHAELMAMAEAKDKGMCMVLTGPLMTTCEAVASVRSKAGTMFCAAHAEAFGIVEPGMSDGRRRARERQIEVNGEESEQ